MSHWNDIRIVRMGKEKVKLVKNRQEMGCGGPLLQNERKTKTHSWVFPGPQDGHEPEVHCTTHTNTVRHIHTITHSPYGHIYNYIQPRNTYTQSKHTYTQSKHTHEYTQSRHIHIHNYT